jgi:hypothetical protein
MAASHHDPKTPKILLKWASFSGALQPRLLFRAKRVEMSEIDFHQF